jgi:crossover junction endodeoxyribonuclease RuvC
MIAIGFDPGVATVGFCVIDFDNGSYFLKDIGCIRTSAKLGLGKRLTMIRDDAEKLIQHYKPDLIAIEELFFVKNVKTGIMVAHARGVLLELAERSKVIHKSFTPLQVKQSVTGYGQATKTQVQKMVKTILKLNSAIRSDDAADAAAVALCGIHTTQGNSFDKRILQG